MNIRTIANFGARFVMRMRSDLRSTCLGRNVPDNDAFAGHACMKDLTIKPAEPARLTALWQVNPQNGHVECHWTTNPEDIASYQALPVLERYGLILAASQQSRATHRIHG
ncbi:hypothetical protein [Ochrobactrum sp. AN78]|uniref:hypothetical protein n=1 Tax=Ochrobactrum sp. AN78 TaxID=3039853 RepID=UPI0017861BA2|nr:hypothetical protein [Ochrobactrum sp. AN78]MBD7992152.1 hypothetical protein [Ochrobactrum gallinarum]MDH7792247.1 hypothetical protein [Ochrobactrum sp. AN78]